VSTLGIDVRPCAVEQFAGLFRKSVQFNLSRPD
jgi:hypothetical protein